MTKFFTIIRSPAQLMSHVLANPADQTQVAGLIGNRYLDVNMFSHLYLVYGNSVAQ
jgi:hypothetical protein